MSPTIKKAHQIVGKNLVLRDITEDDAEFVLALRIDPIKSRHLSATSASLDSQREWIRGYHQLADQAYFIICAADGTRLGCIRMYDPQGESYSWGSWLMIDGLSPLVSMESVLLMYAYGKHLGFSEARIDVRQENTAVWNFHEKFSSAKLVSETDADRFYLVESSSIERMLAKYRHFLSAPLEVVTA